MPHEAAYSTATRVWKNKCLGLLEFRREIDYHGTWMLGRLAPMVESARPLCVDVGALLER